MPRSLAGLDLIDTIQNAIYLNGTISNGYAKQCQVDCDNATDKMAAWDSITALSKRFRLESVSPTSFTVFC